MSKRFSELTDAGTLTGSEDVPLSRESSTSYTATTISFAAADNSINDSAGQFVAEGFVQGQSIRVSGASNGVNNIYTGRIQTITTAKIVIAAPEGAAIIDESAGASVTITLLESVRTTVSDIAGAAATDAASVTYTPANNSDWDGSSDPGNVNGALDELAARMVAAEAASAGSSIGKHAVWVAAGSITPSATGGCAALATIASASNQPDIQTLDFDATTQEYAQFSIHMPSSWNEGTITFKPVWSHAATTTNFGVVWDLQAVSVSDDDGIAVAFGTAQTSTDTGGTTNDVYIGPESSAITVGGTPAAGDMVFFRLSRVTGNGSDTMAIDARLHGITVFMTTDAGTDS